MATDAFTERRRVAILLTCCLSLFIVGVDLLGVNVALPAIRHDLGASDAQLQWVVDAYALVLAGLLTLAGSAADALGRRRVFRTGLVAFGLGSVLCSLAPTAPLLIGARMLQAAGGAMLNPVAMSIVTQTFPEARERARAIGIWGLTVGLSMALGPVVGGGLVDWLGWRAVFWVNLPVVVVALVLTRLVVPESRPDVRRRPDPLGQVAVIVVLATLTFAIIEGRERGWTSAVVVSCFVVSAVTAVLLVRYERGRAQPLIDPRFFASIPFSGAVVAGVLGFASLGGFLFLNTLYLQQVRGMTPLHAGLLTLPMAVAAGAFGPVSGRLVGTVGSRLPLVLAGLGIGTSAVLLTRLEHGTSLGYLVAAYICFGVGFGLLNTPITNAAVSGMPLAQAGVAAAVASTSRQVGTALGVAVLGTIAYAGIRGGFDAGFASATHAAWWVMAGCGAGVVVFGLLSTSAAAERSAQTCAPGSPADQPPTTKLRSPRGLRRGERSFVCIPW